MDEDGSRKTLGTLGEGEILSQSVACVLSHRGLRPNCNSISKFPYIE